MSEKEKQTLSQLRTEVQLWQSTNKSLQDKLATVQKQLSEELMSGCRTRQRLEQQLCDERARVTEQNEMIERLESALQSKQAQFQTQLQQQQHRFQQELADNAAQITSLTSQLQEMWHRLARETGSLGSQLSESQTEAKRCGEEATYCRERCLQLELQVERQATALSELQQQLQNTLQQTQKTTQTALEIQLQNTVEKLTEEANSLQKCLQQEKILSFQQRQERTALLSQAAQLNTVLQGKELRIRELFDEKNAALRDLAEAKSAAQSLEKAARAAIQTEDLNLLQAALKTRWFLHSRSSKEKQSGEHGKAGDKLVDLKERKETVRRLQTSQIEGPAGAKTPQKAQHPTPNPLAKTLPRISIDAAGLLEADAELRTVVRVGLKAAK